MPLPDERVFPKALRKRDQWVQWYNDDGEKVPMQCSFNQRASSTNPDTWTTFYDASHDFDPEDRTGLGFVLSAEDPFVVLDLDKVRNPKTGVTIPWARKLIDGLNSLTYISVSGQGYHIWVRSREPLPGPGLSIKWPGAPKTALEIFYDKRYIVMSGNLHRKLAIEDRTEPVLALYEKIATHKAKKSQAAKPPSARGRKSFFDVKIGGNPAKPGITLQDWLDRRNVHYRIGSNSSVGTVYKLLECPWGGGHTKGKDGIGHAAVFVKNGKWSFACCHNHCSSYGWQDFKREVA